MRFYVRTYTTDVAIPPCMLGPTRHETEAAVRNLLRATVSGLARHADTAFVVVAVTDVLAVDRTGVAHGTHLSGTVVFGVRFEALVCKIYSGDEFDAVFTGPCTSTGRAVIVQPAEAGPWKVHVVVERGVEVGGRARVRCKGTFVNAADGTANAVAEIVSASAA